MFRCRLIAITALIIVQTHAHAADLNGGFEAGVDSPSGWTRGDAEGVVLLAEGGRTGRAALVRSLAAAPGWYSEPIALPGNGAIVSAWIQVQSGKAWLQVQAGSARYSSPPAEPSAEWQYVAVEVPPAPDAAQIALVADTGTAVFDDVSVLPAIPELMNNPGFEADLDRKGRVPFWSEETTPDLAAGQSGGKVSLTVDGAPSGTHALALTATGDWYALGSVNYSVPKWSQEYVAQVRAQCGQGAAAQLALLWSNDAQKILRMDKGPQTQAQTWELLRTEPLKVPEGATALRIVLLAQRSAGAEALAMFDDAQLIPLASKTPVVQVAVNQAGYVIGAPKRAIVMTSFFPTETSRGAFSLRSESGAEVLRGDLHCTGRMLGQNQADWGWYFWNADLSSVDMEGKYTLEASFPEEQATSFPFQIARDALFLAASTPCVEFFFTQRCGGEVPGWHAPCHLDGAKLPDGTHKDLVGGWHSAGDYNKLAWEYGDGGVMYSLICAYEAVPQQFAGRDRDGDGLEDVIEEAQWGADYVRKIMREDGSLLNHIEQGPDRATWMKWCPPEQTTDNQVGTADDPIVTQGNGTSPLAPGAFARLARVLDKRGIANDYLSVAQKAWEAASTGGTATGNPLLMLSAIDLHQVTGDQKYLDYCRANAEALLAQGGGAGQLAGGYGNSGDATAVGLGAFALAHPDDSITKGIALRFAEHLPLFLREAQNPLGLMMQQPGENGYFFEPTSTLGCNNQIALRAWSALIVYRVVHDPRALQYALDQMDFILGRNTYNVCMMEGVGTFNPPRYHHRYVTIPGHERGNVPGTIPNGFVRDIGGYDRPGMDMSTESTRPYPSYRTNEPWLVHNVLFLLTATSLHQAMEDAPAAKP